MEWGANPQRAGHCNVEPPPRRKQPLAKAEKAGAGEEAESGYLLRRVPQGGMASVLQYPYKTIVLYVFYLPALGPHCSQSVPKLKMSGPSFAKGGEPSPPASFPKHRQHEIIRQTGRRACWRRIHSSPSSVTQKSSLAFPPGNEESFFVSALFRLPARPRRSRPRRRGGNP